MASRLLRTTSSADLASPLAGEFREPVEPEAASCRSSRPVAGRPPLLVQAAVAMRHHRELLVAARGSPAPATQPLVVHHHDDPRSGFSVPLAVPVVDPNVKSDSESFVLQLGVPSGSGSASNHRDNSQRMDHHDHQDREDSIARSPLVAGSDGRLRLSLLHDGKHESKMPSVRNVLEHVIMTPRQVAAPDGLQAEAPVRSPVLHTGIVIRSASATTSRDPQPPLGTVALGLSNPLARNTTRTLSASQPQPQALPHTGTQAASTTMSGQGRTDQQRDSGGGGGGGGPQWEAQLEDGSLRPSVPQEPGTWTPTQTWTRGQHGGASSVPLSRARPPWDLNRPMRRRDPTFPAPSFREPPHHSGSDIAAQLHGYRHGNHDHDHHNDALTLSLQFDARGPHSQSYSTAEVVSGRITTSGGRGVDTVEHPRYSITATSGSTALAWLPASSASGIRAPALTSTTSSGSGTALVGIVRSNSESTVTVPNLSLALPTGSGSGPALRPLIGPQAAAASASHASGASGHCHATAPTRITGTSVPAPVSVLRGPLHARSTTSSHHRDRVAAASGDATATTSTSSGLLAGLAASQAELAMLADPTLLHLRVMEQHQAEAERDILMATGGHGGSGNTQAAHHGGMTASLLPLPSGWDAVLVATGSASSMVSGSRLLPSPASLTVSHPGTLFPSPAATNAAEASASASMRTRRSTTPGATGSRGTSSLSASPHTGQLTSSFIGPVPLSFPTHAPVKPWDRLGGHQLGLEVRHDDDDDDGPLSQPVAPAGNLLSAIAALQERRQLPQPLGESGLDTASVVAAAAAVVPPPPLPAALGGAPAILPHPQPQIQRDFALTATFRSPLPTQLRTSPQPQLEVAALPVACSSPAAQGSPVQQPEVSVSTVRPSIAPLPADTMVVGGSASGVILAEGLPAEYGHDYRGGYHPEQ